MLKTRKILQALYSTIFYSENVNIVLLSSDEFKNSDIIKARVKDTNLLLIDEDLFKETHYLVKKYDDEKEIIDESKIDIISAFEEMKTLEVVKHDFSSIKEFNIDLKNSFEKIINDQLDILHVVLMNPKLIESLEGLYKSVLITEPMNDAKVVKEIKKAYNLHKKTKFKLSLMHNVNYMNGKYDNGETQESLDATKINDIKREFINKLENKDSNEKLSGAADYHINDNKFDNYDSADINLLNEDYKILNIVKCDENFDNIIGLDKIKKQLKKLAMLYKEDEVDLAKHKISRDKGFILYGEPGTGKTMLCKAFSNVIGGIFIYLSMEQFISKKNEDVSIAKLFEELDDLSKEYKDENIVLFLDEIDSLRGRGTSDHNNSYYDGFTNEMLYKIDNIPKNVMIIGATNNLETLDDALIRKGRLGNQYEVKNNFKKEEIIKYVQDYFKDGKMGVLNKHSEMISTMIHYMNGSEIANIINKIKQNYYFKKKFDEKGTIRTLIIDTIYGEKYNLADYKVTDDEAMSTAYHEAGHAIMYMHFYGIKDLHEVSIYPTAKTLGFVSYKFDKAEVTKDDLKKLTLISLAGRYGEKLFTDNISTGAISDLENANKHIESIISKYGMGGVENIHINRELNSDYMLTKMDKEHEELLKLYSKETEKIIDENKDVIENLAKDLFEKKVIIGEFDSYLENTTKYL